jgi:hypothetical protein
MTTIHDTQNGGIQREITAALDDLQGGLERAARAAGAIRELLPRVGALGSLFDELEAVVRSGRAQIGAIAPGQITPQARPTLMIPNAPGQPAAPSWDPTADERMEPAQQGDEAPAFQPTPDLVSFRIEFESAKAPLELRAVDDAIGEHPAVRDVALLDYDGRRATLKIWIDAATTPSDIEESLRERLPDLFGEGATVTITALDEAA